MRVCARAAGGNEARAPVRGWAGGDLSCEATVYKVQRTCWRKGRTRGLRYPRSRPVARSESEDMRGRANVKNGRPVCVA